MENFSFEDLEGLGISVGSGNGGGGYTRLEPPMETLQDGTLEITDFVKGVELSGAIFENDNAIFTFREKKTGATIRKWLQDPLTRNHIMNMDDSNPDKKKFIGFGYNEVISLYKNFVKPYLVDAKLREIKPINMETLTLQLFELVTPENANEKEVWLKVAFQKPTGVEPKFIVPQNNYVGNSGYPPKWILTNPKNPKYVDHKNFSTEEKSATDFMAPATTSMAPTDLGAIDDVFGLSAPAAPAPDASAPAPDGSSTLNTPPVNLLG